MMTENQITPPANTNQGAPEANQGQQTVPQQVPFESPESGKGAVDGKAGQSENSLLGGGADKNQPTESKDEAKPASDDDKGKAEEKPAGAPKKYEFTKPEGVYISDAVISAFSEASKELNLTQEAAQSIMNKVAPVMAQQQMQALEKQRSAWRDEMQNDSNFGGKKFEENLGIANKAFREFFDKDSQDFIIKSGMADYPGLVRAMHKIGMAISQDGFVKGGMPSRFDVPIQDRLYPNEAKS